LEAIDDTPAVLVDLDVLDANIRALQSYCDEHRIALWPHCKTHKSTWIAARQLAAGSTGLTFAKSSEMERVIPPGLERALLAYPLIGETKLARVIAVARRCELSVMLDSVVVAAGLSAAARHEGIEIDVLVELDVGLGRVGVRGAAAALAVAVEVDRLPSLRLRGIGCYPGHLREPDEIDEGLPRVAALLAETAAAFDAAGLCRERVSSGATPTAFRVHECPEVNESRVGTYVLGDLSDDPASDFAMTVLATVVSANTSSTVVIDAGGKTLSADPLLRVGGRGFGRIAGEPRLTVTALFDEHGVVSVPEGVPMPRVGDRLRVVPNHCVAVMNLHDSFLVTSGGAVVDVVPIEGRGAVR
jgi:D-serine deaminase-like pyridoxal phosphate-dependent protein